MTKATESGTNASAAKEAAKEAKTREAEKQAAIALSMKTGGLSHALLLGVGIAMGGNFSSWNLGNIHR